MSTQAITAAARANGRDAVAALKSRARDLKDTGLPKAASAAESAGKAISSFALSSSGSVAKSLRNHVGSRRRKGISGAALLRAAPLARTAGRFALRNPAILVAAGAAFALIGYAAWKRQQADAQDDTGETGPLE